jgi:putative two-component system response regulator
MFQAINAATTPDKLIATETLDFTGGMAKLLTDVTPNCPALTNNLFNRMTGFLSNQNASCEHGPPSLNDRTQFYIKALSEKLREHPRFAWYLTEDTINMLFMSAPLHDIGKAGIPDFILLKPGRLKAHEFGIMKTYTTLGHAAIAHAGNALCTSVDLLTLAKTIALSHQEWWDGSGYPYGVAGDDIPIPARLMAVVDVYDALVSRRAYKKAMSHDKAVQIMIKERGTHFDADMLDAFVEIQDEFRAIAMNYADTESAPENLTDFPALARRV